MEARARVHAVHAGRVRLECESPAQACGACSGSRGCALRWLAGPGNPQLDVAHPMPEGAPLRAGDGVIIEVDDGQLLRAAAIAYMPPLAALLASPAAAAALTSGSELAALAGAVAVSTGGTLAPGNSVGTLTVGSAAEVGTVVGVGGQGAWFDRIDRIEAGNFSLKREGFLEPHNPLRQAQSCMFDIKHSVERQLVGMAPLPVIEFAVAFPNISVEQWTSNGWRITVQSSHP